jgi:hypothetical protein
MDWTVFFTSILTSLVSAGGAYELVFKHWLARDLESHKHKMKAESDLAIEQIKNDLQIRALEHEVRFRTLHERQAKIISTVYGKLYALDLALRQYAHPAYHQNKDQCLAECQEASDRLTRFFYPRRLFFPETTAFEIQLLLTKYMDIIDKFTKGREEMTEPFWMHTWEDINTITKPLFGKLEREFQKLMGLEQSIRSSKGP